MFALRIRSQSVNVVRLALLLGTFLALSVLSVSFAEAQTAGTVYVNPGDNIQQLVNTNPAGTTFIIRAGIHRNNWIIPRNGNRFIGEPGAVLSGAILLTNFTREGNNWVSTGRTEEGPHWGVCRTGLDRCNRPEVLFINNVPLRHANNLSQLSTASGMFFFDYNADKVYFNQDPTGRTVELGVTLHAFDGDASDVRIEGLTIEKYANPGQLAAVRGPLSRSWHLENNLVQLNQGVGINIGNGMRVINNRVLRNGQLGISGTGQDVLIEGNEIAWNNFSGFYEGWEAGGAKFVYSSQITMRNNYVHDNDGMGLWTDIDNIDVTYENNLVTGNQSMGIFHEISYRAVIRNNIVMFNSVADYPWLYGGQIMVSSSRDTQVLGNRVVVSNQGGNGITIVQQARGTGRYGPYLSQNIEIRGNTVVHLGSVGQSGAAQDTGDSQFWTSRNNRMDGNTYLVSDLNARYWSWSDRQMSWNELRQAGQEATGTLSNNIPAEMRTIPAWQFRGTQPSPPTPTRVAQQPSVTPSPTRIAATASPTVAATQTIRPTNTPTTTQAQPTATVAAASAPYYGAPLPIPGRIEAEDFNRGTNGSAYSDTTPGMEGGNIYRQDSVDVDLKSNAYGTHTLGWFINGEWTTYTVNVAQAGSYDITIHGGSVEPRRMLSILFNGQPTASNILMPTVANWDTHEVTVVRGVQLNAGIQEMRLVSTLGFLDVDYVEFTLAGSAQVPTVAATATPQPTSVPATSVPTQPAVRAVSQVPSVQPNSSVTVDFFLDVPQQLPGGGARALEAVCTLSPANIAIGTNVTAGSLFGADALVINAGFRPDNSFVFATSQTNPASLVTTGGVAFSTTVSTLAAGQATLQCNVSVINGNRVEAQLPFAALTLNVGGQASTAVPPTAVPPSPTPTQVPPTAIPPTATVAPPTPTSAPQNGGVRGTVFRSHAAPANTTITLLTNGQSVATTSITSTGTFELTNVAPGSYTIRASSPGHLPGEGSVTIVAGQTIEKAPLILLAGDLVASTTPVIDELDVVQLAIAYGTTTTGLAAAGDLDENGRIGLGDLVAIAENLRRAGPIAWN